MNFRFVAIAATALAGVPLGAQSLTIGTTPACSRCSFAFDRVAELTGEFADGAAQGRPVAWARDSKGLSYAVYNGRLHEVVVHDATGKFARKFGVKGLGPGEYQAITLLKVDRGDSLHIIDTRSRRRTVLAPNGRLVRSTALPEGTISADLLAGDRIAMAAMVMTPDRIGQPLHIVHPSRGIENSFGVKTAVFRPDMEDMLLRWIARASDTTFWASSYSEYRLELWDYKGKLHRTLAKSPDWFRPWLHAERPTPHTPPQSRGTAIVAAGENELWMLSSVPDRRWKQAVVRDTSVRTAETRYRITDTHLYLDALIEAVEVSTGRLIASQRFDSLFSIREGGYVLRVRDDTGGSVHVFIEKLRLVRP